MWCVQCNEEFSDDIVSCPQCGDELGELPKASWGMGKVVNQTPEWPVHPDGEPESPVFLAHTSGKDMEDTMLAGMLTAYGVAHIKRYPNDGELGRLIIGLPGSGVDFYVPESMLSQARELMEEQNDENEL